MDQVVSWWLAIELLSLAALPITLTLFKSLPDRGYAFGKAFGVLVVGYFLWLAGTLHLLPNGRGSIILLACCLGGLSLLVVARHRLDLVNFIRSRGSVVLVTELVFLGSFVLWTIVRAYAPQILGTEQPMDFGFLNAIARSEYFPPNDMWLAGQSISYYYFGYLIMAMLAKLSGVAMPVAYNLALSSLFALTATGAFGVGFNLVAGRTSRAPEAPERPRSMRAPVLIGLLAAVLVLGIGNLQGALEVVRANGVGTVEFWRWVGVNDALQPYQSPTGLPVEPMWWWRTTRVINTLQIQTDPGGEPVVNDQVDYTIEEFPAFSFVLGDLHPHIMALPFVMLAIAAALDVFSARISDERVSFRRSWLRFGVFGLIVGALGFINSWDLPTYGGLFVIALLAGMHAQKPRSIWRLVRDSWPLVVTVAVASVVLYAPFYVGFRSQASGVLPVLGPGTRWIHFAIVWGFFLIVSIGFLIAEFGRLRHRSIRRAAWSLAIPIALIAVWVGVRTGGVAVARSLGIPIETAAPIEDRLVQLIPIALLAGLCVWLTVSEIDNFAETRDEKQSRAEASTVFAALLLGLGALLVLVPELFFIKDVFGTRMNTVFKVYYQVWVLFALASAYAIYLLVLRWRSAGAFLKAPATVGLGVVLVTFMASLIFTPVAVDSKVSGFANTPTLDGLAYMRQTAADEYAAVSWLQRQVEGAPVVAAAVGGQYSEFGLVAARTGFPTVLGWAGHELQWRGSDAAFRGREQDVDRIFKAPAVSAVQDLIDKYQIRYVYFGPLERSRYGQAAANKFGQGGQIVFKNQAVTIYRLPLAGDAVGVLDS